MTRKRKWLRSILVLAILLLAASFGISRALRTDAARRYLLAHLEASFGRPVEVGRFDFSLLDGARIAANSITVSEDPQFGHEYFLRADALRAGLRWSALLSGRFEFGSLSLSRPSLNLVRDARGRWNVEQWLPPASPPTSRPGFVGPPSADRNVATARLYRIDVDGGRINFKQGDEKTPLALTDVSGRVDHDSAGRWQLDLEGQPMRAGVGLQQIGTLRLRGTIAGTSARLQPAELSLTWRDVSLADALRFSRGADSGVRGNLNVDLTAKIAPSRPDTNAEAAQPATQWSISAAARLTGFHEWQTAGRDIDPGLSLAVDAAWRLGDSHVQIRKIEMEMPNTHMQGTGEVDWARGFRPELRITSSRVGLSDVLSWYRALRPSVPENLSAEGILGVELTLGGWPPRIEQGALAGVGGRLTAPFLPSPLRIGAINAGASRGGLDFAPIEISFVPVVGGEAKGMASTDDSSPNLFILRGAIFPEESSAFRRPMNWNFSIDGATPHIENWLALSEALAQPLNTGWTAAGGLDVKMRSSRKPQIPSAAWLGTMEVHDLRVSPAFLNQPLVVPKAHLEFAASQKTITVSGTQVFGTTWQGSATRKNADARWTFDVSADRLDTAELDRWLGPRARPSILSLFAGFEKPPAEIPDRNDTIAKISAGGRLRVSEIVLPPLRVQNFDGLAELSGRTVTIRKAQADFYGGKLSGVLNAALNADASYRFEGRFERVDLVRLGRALPSLNNRISGIASATLTLFSHGIGRDNLIRSIGGDGKLDARNAELRGLDFASAIYGGGGDSSPEPFASARGTFRVGSGGIEVSDFLLENSLGRFQAEGLIGFSHALDLRIHPSIFHVGTKLAGAPPTTFLLGGTLEAPTVSLPVPAAPAASKPGTRGR